MRVSVCVGDYATTPYCITGLGVPVYCLEELCYCLRENAFLLDMSLLDVRLVDWINEECKVNELARELYSMVRKQGSLSGFVTLIMDYVGLYDSDTVREVERVLKEGSGLSGIEKRKNQVDYLVRKKKYPAAVHRYDDLLTRWDEETESGLELPVVGVKAGILHNKGVALACMMEYGAAAECFREANEIEANEESYMAYLAAKRMELEEGDYLAFIADRPESYEQSLRLEKKIEELSEGFAGQESGVILAELKDFRYGGEKQKYYNELERIGQALKEGYRNSVSE